jgi:hypothetical protein
MLRKTARGKSPLTTRASKLSGQHDVYGGVKEIKMEGEGRDLSIKQMRLATATWI